MRARARDHQNKINNIMIVRQVKIYVKQLKKKKKKTQEASIE